MQHGVHRLPNSPYAVALYFAIKCVFAAEKNMLSHQIFDSSIPTIGRQTKAVWAQDPSQGALVFVHGFNGSAVRTWADFPVQLRKNAEYAHWDAVFFGYDGRNTEAVSSAAELRNLLNLMENPKDFYGQSDAAPHAHRQHPAAYKRILLVTHSLGAIVARRAMLDGYQQALPAKWASKVQVFNFAPALRGAKIIALLADAFGSPLVPMLAIAHLFNQLIVLRDLEEKGQTVVRLEEETRKAVSDGLLNLRAVDAVWSKNDPVVTNGRFADDPVPDALHIVENTTHSSVCKPSLQYSLPSNALIRHL